MLQVQVGREKTQKERNENFVVGSLKRDNINRQEEEDSRKIKAVESQTDHNVDMSDSNRDGDRCWKSQPSGMEFFNALKTKELRDVAYEMHRRPRPQLEWISTIKHRVSALETSKDAPEIYDSR
jgi:hypothetical protein